MTSSESVYTTNLQYIVIQYLQQENIYCLELLPIWNGSFLYKSLVCTQDVMCCHVQCIVSMYMYNM